MQTKNQILLLFYFLLLFTACKTKAPQSSDVETIKFEDQDDDNEEEANETIEKEEEESHIIDTVRLNDTIIPLPPILKENYKIAILLPFMEDSVRKKWEEAKPKSFQNFIFPKQAEIVSSFYEGFIFALENLELNSTYNIKLYDTKLDLATTQNILKEIRKDSFDVIIGPYAKKNIVEVSKYTSTNNIIHISPFSPSKSASLGNDNYYMVEPSLEQHILNILEYSLDSIANPNIKFVYHNSNSGKSYMQLVKNYLDAYNENEATLSPIEYSFVQIEEELEIDEKLEIAANNVLIVNSFEEDFIHVLLRQIASLDADLYPLTVFGMPGWERSKIVRLSYLNSENVHFSSALWKDKPTEKTSTLNEQFEEKYKYSFNENASLGFDIANVFISIIDKKGLDFKQDFLGYEYLGIHRNYLFKDVIDNNNNTHRIENTDLHIYKIEEFEKVLLK